MRDLSELIDEQKPAWPMLQQWFSQAKNRVEVLPASDPARTQSLLETQVTTRSPLGAVVYETGGLLVDHGWIRILGSGHLQLPRSLPEWNLGRTRTKSGEVPGFLLVADDVLGGFFAINGGALGEDSGNVYYFAPDTLKWENLERSYTEFLDFCLNGDLQKYYEGCRWSGWETEVAALTGDRAFSIYPMLFAEGPDISERDRISVPLAELYDLYLGNIRNEGVSR
ncbi:MAG TPA: DUF2625 domain-containing protein [Blastocatellia bacterium]|nr:DUF2625 domain-containing protein [Blastocatellia bacterium]HMV86593.1 DUF2625 domain-containing protein [Blastocatellia bacterium]HMX24335.1 DUF2625 domain-containing protein [Blastocatellia bacterium]HMY70708.1 DUF2625 domain-containing protein [Blastocatellia bacterium]HMZ16546.1 DUF2625 domain-containing protein [Blastocatellia bacterium]